MRVLVEMLDRVEDGGLVTLRPGDDLTLSGLHSNCAFALAVHVKQLTEVETGTLQDLDFVDEDIVEWIDGLTGLFDVFADGVGDQLVDGFLQVGRTNLLGDDLHHLTADVLDLLRLGIGSLLDLVLSVVRFMPWKLVRQLRPWTSSQMRRNLRKA